MKLVSSQDFLTMFKQVEKAIRDVYTDECKNATSPVAFYEDKISKEELDRSNFLMHLRQKRNIITHNPTYADLIPVTDTDIEFLNQIYIDVMSVNGIIKDFYIPFKQYKKIACVTESNTLGEALTAVTKLAEDSVRKNKYVYILNDDKTTVNYITFYDLLCIAATTRASVKIKNLTSKFKTLPDPVDISAPISDNLKKPVPVMSRKKIVGILI